MDGKLDMGQHCALMTLKANRILNCIKRRGANRAGEMILPLCSVLLRPHLEYFVHMWSPRYRRNMDLLERAQRRVAKMIQGMKHCSYKDRLRELGLFSLGKRSLWGDLRAASQCLKRGYKKEGDSLAGSLIGQGKMVSN